MKEKFIQDYEDSKKFNEFQMYQIQVGYEHNLSIEQIKVFAKTEYSVYQMQEIRVGFEKGLTMEQVLLYVLSQSLMNFKW